jgi:hypothetical protein
LIHPNPLATKFLDPLANTIYSPKAFHFCHFDLGSRFRVRVGPPGNVISLSWGHPIVHASALANLASIENIIESSFTWFLQYPNDNSHRRGMADSIDDKSG